MLAPLVGLGSLPGLVAMNKTFLVSSYIYNVSYLCGVLKKFWEKII